MVLILASSVFINADTADHEEGLWNKNVIGPVKTGHICTNYTCLENGTLFGYCVR